MKKLFLMLVAILSIALSSSAQTRTVSGVVLDGESEPLVGASVIPVGQTRGVTTDADGRFAIVIDSKVKELQISYVGMETVVVPATDNMKVTLKPAVETLQALVVTGYGSAKKIGSVVGAVSVVGEAVLETSTTPNFVDALQGEVAGLNIYSNTGDPGLAASSNSVTIRGINSLNGGNAPLYILDGAPVTAQVFTALSPQDIENIAVLKDAASLSVYGARAANGVIVITTKKGKLGEKPRFTLRASAGWSDLASDNMPMMNSQQYIHFRDLIGQPVTDEIREIVNKYGISTDWVKEMFLTTPTYQIDGSVSGGSEKSNYYLSFNHMDQQGITIQSGSRREALRASLESRITDWFKVGFQTTFSYKKYDYNYNADADGVYSASPVVFARMAYPYDSPYYYTIENGAIKYGEKAEYLHYTQSPTPEWYVNNFYDYQYNTVTLNSSLYEQFNPVKGLTLRAQQALDAYENRNSYMGKPGATIKDTPMGDSYDPALSGSNTQNFGRYYQFTYTNTAEYKFNIKNLHNFSVLVGEESIITKTNSFGARSTGQTDLRQMLLQQGTTVAINNLSQSISQIVSNSIFATLSYDYNDTYFLDASFRRDGSSKFAPGHRWANFFAVGAMWNMKNEKFLQPVTWIDDLRIRASYGTTGNTSGIGNYAYFGLVGSYGNTYNGGQAIGIAQAPNYDLTWETVRSTDVGVTAGLFDHLDVDVDFYHKETVDMLMDIPYSFTTGFSSGAGNIATMTNTGVDVDVRANIIKTRDWNWMVKANFNYNRNRITKLFAGRDYYTIANTGLRYEVGHSAGEFYYVKFAGVDPRDGTQMWYDVNGNLTKNYNEETMSVMTGYNRYAPWTGGFGTQLSWKGLSLQLDFNWAAKKYMINNDRYFTENTSFGNSWNQMTTMLNVWTTPGQVTDIPKVGQEIQFDSRFIEDASFMRLKNLTLQYQLPTNLVNKAGFSNIAVRFTSRNLFTVTSYSGYDPEPSSNIVAFWYPNTRQFEFGLDVSF
ncbi:MAG: SusC/RagA family TonB-linked outer membrane protein [Muribaculaceae bacterium]|nr:SusC/RagA family TonB-linked outer membrane protein [Muribaculaceae bacterium]